MTQHRTCRAFMRAALSVAQQNRFTIRGRALAGCVLAKEGGIIAKGARSSAGEAETEALRQAGRSAFGATAYITMEPREDDESGALSVDSLIEAKVAHAVFAARGRSSLNESPELSRLRAAGVAVTTGLCEAEATDMNRGFLSRTLRKRPWVCVKLGISLDGRTALESGESKWITGDKARADVQKLRAAHEAIMVGSGTVIADDPTLIARVGAKVRFQPPIRVVLDQNRRVPPGFKVLNAEAPTVLLHGPNVRACDGSDPRCIEVGTDKAGLNLESCMSKLSTLGINNVLVEAGARLSGSLFEKGLVDELVIYMAPVLLGAKARPMLAGLDVRSMMDRKVLLLVDHRFIAEDQRLTFLTPPASEWLSTLVAESRQPDIRRYRPFLPLINWRYGSV